MLVLLASCKPTERIIVKTEFRDRIKLDSIYYVQHDSVHITDKGDTLVISTYHTVFKDRIRIQKDTVNHTDTIRVIQTFPKSKETLENGNEKDFFWWVGFILVIVLAAFAVFKLVTWSPIKTVFKKLLNIN